jgi:hypothetical protein
MSDDSTTECLLFPEIFLKPVVAQFDQREGSSDGGALLLKAADGHYRLVEELAACLQDQRQAGKVDHTLRDLVAQRVFSIACGYPDGNDSARLGSDPIHKLLLGRDPPLPPDRPSPRAEGVDVMVARAYINQPIATAGEESTVMRVRCLHSWAPVLAFSAYILLSWEPTETTPLVTATQSRRWCNSTAWCPC